VRCACVRLARHKTPGSASEIETVIAGAGGLAAQLAQLPDEVVARELRSDQPPGPWAHAVAPVDEHDAGAAQAPAFIAHQVECAGVAFTLLT
jgi:hypothetical protein